MADTEARTAREEWGSRFGFLMAMLGAMVGAGNIWRMPFTTGENGGGAFLVAYILLLYVIAVPGLMAETMIGRYTNNGVIGAFKQVFGSKRAQGLGLVVLIVNVALMSYYAPIIGWALYYAGHSILMTFTQPGFQPQAFWDGFINNPALVIGMHTATMAGLAGVLVFGIRRGIERVVKWMIPLLVVALIAVAVRGVTLPGGMDGVAFVFTPDWGYLTRGSTWVAALSQALFSTGLGWGIALTYGSYLSRYDDVPLGGGLFTAIGNTSVGLLAVFATFPVVFAFGLEPSAGSNLLFLSLAEVFPELPGGGLWALVFFVSFFFATFTSGLGITEVGVTTVSEETRLSRTKSVLAVCGVIWLLGLPSAYSSSFLGQMDFIFGSFGLPLATLSIIALVAWKFGPERARVIDLNRNAGIYIGSAWNPVIKYVIPVVMLFIIGYGVVTSLGTENQQLMILGVAIMAGLVVVSTAIMSVIGTVPEKNAESTTLANGGD
ncbi:sodium-dependent transporter (plasmid) [Haloferax mediterranei ATCC 33500]|uniref:Sodium-and chloride-dependent transporter n=3 Tax=Haloferax mediterranei (strain ATCC 33500 / DSM 1411 / JCM 8866 / NBRC 14739 / NCIMB 2177 / R-4) TaxID=523841 RepID=I3RA49_HALMT|nr:sodium-dependent transporter [Haloferax mediterranei]AFK21109.1 sodium-and chloride-dependent transporter [Haloferax mediterranei ATCC 33500]MDX5989812.1 sodium-dependent transporter [Haloferax mediterranei ATCC 33500]QCQ77254.1 sodium-dependent transporter [Haloferax mediterranei ATCC 33500]